ncbi:fused MFS/spermidine synthase [Gemmata sp. JC717]|uniref:fused MFS/spermidine synthase n=1 Tax=Gemmata algarum TaxID=2975278 RepID=UPI0021BAF389|nr:fused MFS/spermidine synthase [Gemmata algarum]MDY3553233.1 fused MFS/spermidine synthase [Gemmata algarum]
MPLLFAVTMFVSASLLFMVQPMVAKAVLPLLGGSPAVWNGCMVFFQALLLLGYLYADRLTRQKDHKKQWVVHCAVLALPVVVFVLAALFSAKHTPIAVVEALAPSGDSSPVLSVLAIMTVAIGIPFFVCSTTATLLQKWFTYTGHPSARDPYFLYAASNFGSLISLLGYPLFIEPNLTQGGQTWVWAVGFVGLAALIVACGKAAVNPLGVAPGGAGAKVAPAPVEQPPSWGRMAKWTALAFVPSSLMLGVTFHMTTDIASIPLLWVGPLALYLVTFIIAFGRVPPWFRLLIGNLAPVMILLLVFSITSGVIGNRVGISLLLHLVTFFTAALMCHYELARDRPSPQYLTTYFLIMSLGGVLGGIFNSLVAPLVFVQDYEYKLVLLVACLMVPRLNSSEGEVPNQKPMDADAKTALDMGMSAAVASPFAVAGRWLFRQIDQNRRVALALDVAVPVLIGLVFWQMLKFSQFDWYNRAVRSIASTLALDSASMVHNIFVYAVPVMVCFFFVDRPLRFTLCVAAILGISTFRDEASDEGRVVYTERSFFGILKVEQRGNQTRLVHGTTLHGTQINETFRPHWADEFQRLTALNPWDNVAVFGTQLRFNPREEPLTYYHRSGPVGAMFQELRTRKGGADANAPVAMVGLGTGSASCYVGAGQKLTFYEIDPAVRRIVETPWKVMNESDLKERGSAPIADPDVRAKVEKLGARILTQEEYDRARAEHEKGQKAWEEYKKKLRAFGTGPLDDEVRKRLERLGAMYTLRTKQDYETALRERGAAPTADPDVRKDAERLGARIFTPDEYEAELKSRLTGKEPIKEPMKDRGVIVYTQEEYEEAARTRPAGTAPVTQHEVTPAPAPVAPLMGPFTYVDDARKRGADIDFRMGDARLKLKEDTDRKYALLLVDAFSSDSIPVHLLTNEAVALYLERLTDDGILALHISNKFVQLEPVVAAIAEHHNLVARVWNDNAEGRPGKTASSWVALARKREHLGDRIASELGDMMGEYSQSEQLIRIARVKYPELGLLLDKALTKQQETVLDYLDKRTGDAQAQRFAGLIRRNGPFTTLMDALHAETGYGFRPVVKLNGVDAWTDDYADVMRVMIIPELQALRRFFGLPTPVADR